MVMIFTRHKTGSNRKWPRTSLRPGLNLRNNRSALLLHIAKTTTSLQSFDNEAFRRAQCLPISDIFAERMLLLITDSSFIPPSLI